MLNTFCQETVCGLHSLCSRLLNISGPGSALPSLFLYSFLLAMTSRSRSRSRSAASSSKSLADDSATTLSTLAAPALEAPSLSEAASAATLATIALPLETGEVPPVMLTDIEEDVRTRAASAVTLETIALRLETGEFPPVLAAEIEEVFRTRATEALTWIKKDEATRIQSYMHMKYQEYRATLPASGDRPEKVVQAEWARDYYYFHLNAWCSQHGCVDADVFVPAVPPQILPEADRAAAESLLSQLLRGQIVQDRVDFENLVKQELGAFVEVLPKTLTAEEVDASIDAFYSEKYYSILAVYLSNRTKSQFTAMIDVGTLSADDEATFKALSVELKASDEKEFHDSVLATWKLAWDKMPTTHLQGQHDAIKQSWLHKNYTGMLATYVSQRPTKNVVQTFIFDPLVALVDLASDAARANAIGVIARVESRHIDLIARQVNDRWHAFHNNLPIRLTEKVLQEVRREWLLQQYYDIIAEVLEGVGVAAEFVPLIFLDELSEGKDREEARAMLPLMTPTLGDALQSKVEQTRRETFQSSDLGDMQITVERHWLVANYYRLMAQVVQEGFSGTSVSQKPSSCGMAGAVHEGSPHMTVSEKASSSVPSMFASPKKRPRQTPEGQVTSLVTRTAAECHTADIAPSNSNRAELYLLYFAEEPRWVEVRDKRTGLQEKVPVLSCLFGDRSGAIQADLWRQVAETQLPLFLHWSETSNEPILLEISSFGVKNNWRRSLRPSRELAINDKTAFSRLEQGSVKTVLSPEVPLSQNLIVSDFRDLVGAIPFVVNLSGFVTNLSDETLSRQEVPMRTFMLQDTFGRYVPCCLHGRHCNNEFLKDRAKIVIFFASATESLGGNPPVLWLWDNSHLIVQRLGCSVPPPTQAVPLGLTSSR